MTANTFIFGASRTFCYTLTDFDLLGCFASVFEIGLIAAVVVELDLFG